MAEPNSDASRRALERVLSSTDLERVVPELPPAELHRAIQVCGLEDCGEVLALATAEQLRELSDLDLWRPDRPGQAEAFDAARFGLWLEVLLDAGPSVAAQRIADLDRDVVTLGFARHVRAFHEVAVAEYMTLDGERMQHRHTNDRLSADVGGFYVIGTRDDQWEVVVEALRCLAAEQPGCFAEVMSAVLALSNAGYEVDELDPRLGRREQQAFDAGVDRDVRREQHGYVSVGDARVFLEEARRTRLADTSMRDASIRDSLMRDAECEMRNALMRDARCAMRDAMAWLLDRDPAAYEARNADLVFLANALVAGCSVRGRAFTVQEAWDAASATCNLALDRLRAPVDVLASRDLIDVFRHGWSILHDDVVMRTADELARVLGRLQWPDRIVQRDVDALRVDLLRQLRNGTPWKSRERMDVLLSLDGPAWETLVGLIAEYPTWRGLIAEEQDLRAIESFLQSLPDAFRP